MATMNLVLLPSSPTKSHYHAPLTMSSSPDGLPSPSAIFRNNRKLKMPTISTKRMSTTPTRTSLDAEKPANDDIWNVPDDDPPAKAVEAPAKKPKKQFPATIDLSGGGIEPVPKKRGRPKKVAAEGENAAPLKEKAVRKPRAKKINEDGQAKIAKGRVTKASTSSAHLKARTKETVSPHFAAAAEEFIDIESILVHQDLELKKAGERRMSWTPAKESGNYPYQVEELSQPQMQDTPIAAQGFGNLVESHGYAKSERSASTSTMEDNNPARKRKLIELVQTGNGTSTSKAKSKAAPKKAITITDKATAQYAAAAEEEEESAPILQYFVREDSGIDPSGAPRTKVTKTFKKPGKGKKAAEPLTALLSPESALNHAKRQEFVFGTSSQLARDDDPAFLRDLQQAMQLSNQYDVDDPFAEPLPSISSNKSGKPNLLEAASMIEEEGAKDIEVLDLTRSSQGERHFTKESTLPATAEVEIPSHVLMTAEPVDDWIVLDETPHPAAPSQHASAAVREISPSPIIEVPAARPQPTQASQPAPAVRATTKPALEPAAKAKPATKVSAAQCPDYDSYSTTDLTKEIAKYKFKAVKKREDMVSLLKKCWEAKQKQAQGVQSAIPKPIEAPQPSSQPPAAPPAANETIASPPRKRGRPKKGDPTTASMRKLFLKRAAVAKAIAPSASAPALSTPKRGRGRSRKVLPLPEDISDAEGPPTPSPPCILTSRARSLEIITESDDDADATLIPLSPSSQERELFQAISRAITTQPRSTDAKIYLSWHEKILLYDPILLEDLTKWLNEEGLGRVGYDGEMMPLQVKSWCIRKGVCCLFKESKRNRGVGGVKKIGRE